MAAQVSIGDRIRHLRYERRPRLTQRELAERAGVSVDLIAKLEQGQKRAALLLTLNKIAHALDVDVSTLLASPQRMVAVDRQAAGVLALRRALILRDDDAERADPADLTRSVGYAWSSYWNHRFDTLTSLLPELLPSARVTAQETGDPGVWADLSEVLVIAASMLVHLGHVDLAYHAMDRARHAADSSGDELRRAAAAGWMSWLLLHQTGSSDQAQRVALEAAEQIRPTGKNPRPQQLSVWGTLLIGAAVAAARHERPDEADDLLAEAETAAHRLDAGPAAIRTDYGSPFGVPQVIMQSVDIAVVSDRPAVALTRARRMAPDAALPLAAKARHLADKAYAFTSLGKDQEATDTLLTIERMAPQWMTYQRYPQTILSELVERERRVRTPALRALATRLGVLAN